MVLSSKSGQEPGGENAHLCGHHWKHPTADPAPSAFLSECPPGCQARRLLRSKPAGSSITCTKPAIPSRNRSGSRCHSYNHYTAAQLRISTDSCFIPPDVFNYFQNIQVWDLKKSMQRWHRGKGAAGPKGHRFPLPQLRAAAFQASQTPNSKHKPHRIN